LPVQAVNGDISEVELLFQKTQFLSTCFAGIPEEELLPLAENITYHTDLKTKFNTFNSDSVIWPLSDDNQCDEALICYSDTKEEIIRKLKDINTNTGYILPLNALEEFQYQYPQRSLEILEYIEVNEE
jgi:hypothetical protein